ncbi:hypothetical protein IscW_ISCW003788 [Ixodes scapularis]|uniref:Uncharacterized protein n=1 Tax=Ixodes scapularis TaxID=6945 RepID=B7PIJ5_IXOSC|nr:hypothetical protein IscW_ISCW003788 [Ixodes scapularis]|eukprot:XP_002405351.1 hypothetical protein IscW_ISCW003788 [Ixodes scapularis]
MVSVGERGSVNHWGAKGRAHSHWGGIDRANGNWGWVDSLDDDRVWALDSGREERSVGWDRSFGAWLVGLHGWVEAGGVSDVLHNTVS